MGKFSKMLYMLDLLNTGNKYSLKELSEKVGVSQRMIRYYKEELESNGIFIESFKGPNGGYFFIDKQKNYTNINKYDIQLLNNIEETLKRDNFEFLIQYEELLEKIKNLSDILEERSKFISNVDIDDDDQMMNMINDTIKKEEKIDIVYKNVDGSILERVIYPLQFFKFKDVLYVTAFCELRKDIRHFEINRILKIK